MTVRQLKQVLAELPPEYDDSIILTEELGFGGLSEVTPSVSNSGASAGMRVFGYTVENAPPSRKTVG